MEAYILAKVNKEKKGLINFVKSVGSATDIKQELADMSVKLQDYFTLLIAYNTTAALKEGKQKKEEWTNMSVELILVRFATIG